MGYSYRNNGHITDYYPDNTEKEFYLEGEYSIAEIIGMCKEKFCYDVNLEDLQISSEYVHTSCLMYNRYDPSDYTNFIVVRLKE